MHAYLKFVYRKVPRGNMGEDKAMKKLQKHNIISTVTKVNIGFTVFTQKVSVL